MALKVILNVDNPEDLLTGYGPGALLHLERDTDSAFAAPVTVDSVPLVEDQSQYEVWDGAGSTASWYRSFVSNATASEFSDFSAPFQAGAPNAYATIDGLRELLQLPDNGRDNLLADLLVRVSSAITGSLGFDFYRHPAVSGTEVRTIDAHGTTAAASPQGFYAVTGATTSTSRLGTYGPITDFYLSGEIQPGGPYLELRLGTVADWVTVTGVFGYPAIPPDIEQATLLWAADLYRIGVGGGTALGQPGIGLEEFGTPVFMQGRMPPFTYAVVEQYRARHRGVLVA